MALRQPPSTPLPKTIPAPPPRTYISMQDGIAVVHRADRPRPQRALPGASSCGGRTSCLLLVAVPTMSSLTMAMLWLTYCHQEFNRLSTNGSILKSQLMHIGRLIVDLNLERELTVVYMTARSIDAQSSLWISLSEARLATDRSLEDLHASSSWSLAEQGHGGYRSPGLFAAVLADHRSALRPTGQFWDEVRFYTDSIDVLLGWLNGAITPRGTDRLPVQRWLIAYSYLMGSLNYIGAEQALCHAFHSVVCFSHRETFHYANFSFAGEAIFRLYRHAFPDPQTRGEDGGWASAPHRRFFPRLVDCRREILSEADYLGIAVDPSMCDFSRRNETRVTETDLITVLELRVLVEAIDAETERDLSRARLWVAAAAALLAANALYTLVAHSVRCAWMRRTSLLRKEKEDPLMEEHRLMAARHRTNSAYDRFNGDPNAIHTTASDFGL